MTNPLLADRDLRQRDILPPDRLGQAHCTVVGTGAIGRQVALQLAAIGVARIRLIDFDVVEPLNLAAQGFLESDLGKPKVEAVAHLCRQINSRVEITTVNDRFKRHQCVGNAVFCCVDSMRARRLVSESAREAGVFFVDGRMSAEVIRVLACSPSDPDAWPRYAATLFGDQEAFRGSCTARSTIFTASIAAGLMLEQYSRHLRRMPVDHDLQLNLLASEMNVCCPDTAVC